MGIDEVLLISILTYLRWECLNPALLAGDRRRAEDLALRLAFSMGMAGIDLELLRE